MTKSLSRLMGAMVALTIACGFWIPASAHAANLPDPGVRSGISAGKKTTSASARHGTRPSRAARVKRAARAPAFAPPGSPPAAIAGAAPAPWRDVFEEAGAWASEPIIVNGSTLGHTIGSAGVAGATDGAITGPRAGLTGLYQTVWHRALSNPILSTQLFIGSPEYFGLRF
ncbi:hypothetical protein LV28_01400 [Pandoraea pnomenusa]|uniref:Uncharacterized protein n=1 Tax=Pandoraea pnomenusa TaxID=93220 RepID=A0A378YD83_9BURK|nr:hypothetical protein [Pandoraea pnomenusa]AIU25398.1 hypothetical protein LV28_01400 [Pandoraea pnomenusa]SUA74377.1 Uncharacterised protein [Pandoraea pnomenusa]